MLAYYVQHIVDNPEPDSDIDDNEMILISVIDRLLFVCIEHQAIVLTRVDMNVRNAPLMNALCNRIYGRLCVTVNKVRGHVLENNAVVLLNSALLLLGRWNALQQNNKQRKQFREKTKELTVWLEAYRCKVLSVKGVTRQHVAKFYDMLDAVEEGPAYVQFRSTDLRYVV